jgi:hypothetical protein
MYNDVFENNNLNFYIVLYFLLLTDQFDEIDKVIQEPKLYYFIEKIRFSLKCILLLFVEHYDGKKLLKII